MTVRFLTGLVIAYMNHIAKKVLYETNLQWKNIIIHFHL